MDIILLVKHLLNFDEYLGELIINYGVFVYFFLFLIIFLETGVVLTPFLPGDSLIFVIGAFAGAGTLDIFLLFFILAAAAIIGDSVNYWIGNYFGENVFSKSRLFKKEYLEKTKKYYKEHGGKTIILARFIPIIRTFAPFVAGVGKMDYVRFLGFNVFGGIVWTGLFLFAGYFFGNIPFVRNNLTTVTLVIITSSLIPVFINYMKQRGKD